MKRILPRFTLGSLFLLVLIVAMGVAWWLDHARLEHELIDAQTRLAASELLAEDWKTAARDFGGMRQGYGVGRTANRNIYATPGEFITALRSTRNYYVWQDRMVEFAATEVADHALPLLIKLLEDPDAEVRERTLLTMSYLDRHAEQLVPVIVGLLADEGQNVRWHAANALGNFGDRAQTAIPDLQRIVEAELSPIAAFAAGIAFKIDPSVDVEPRLQIFLRSDDREIRWRAVEALSGIVPHINVQVATEEALLEAFRLSEEDSSKRHIAHMLERIKQGPTSISFQGKENRYDEAERRKSLSEAPRWKGTADDASVDHASVELKLD
jgi:hypothetical protein